MYTKKLEVGIEVHWWEDLESKLCNGASAKWGGLSGWGEKVAKERRERTRVNSNTKQFCLGPLELCYTENQLNADLDGTVKPEREFC